MYLTKSMAARRLGILPSLLDYRIRKGFYPKPYHKIGDSPKTFYSQADVKLLEERTEQLPKRGD